MPVNRVFWVIAFAAFMFGVGWFAVRWLTRRAATEYRREAENLEKISSLSITEAASKALPLLLDVSLFRSIESPARDDEALKMLAPELRKVLQRYETIESKNASQASVIRSSIGLSALKPDFLRIGSIATGADVEGEIGVRPGDETIYELYPNEAPDPTFGTYRSIYHWVLAMAEEAK